jgi:hypothetical protein
MSSEWSGAGRLWIVVAVARHSRLARDVDDVVDTSLDPEVAVLVTGGTVTEEEVSGVGAHVGVEVTLVVTVDGTGNGRPRLLQTRTPSTSSRTLPVVGSIMSSSYRRRKEADPGLVRWLRGG